VLTAGAVSAVRGTEADGVLSRCVSRYRHFPGKWHARPAAAPGTYLAPGVLALGSSLFLLHQGLSLGGCLIALVTVAALLAAVITCGVTVSALTNSTVVGIAVLWVVLCGGFAPGLPSPFPSPGRELHRLPHVLDGEYNLRVPGERITWSAGVSFAVCNRSRVEGDSRAGMRKARMMVGAGTGRRTARPDGRADSRPGLGIPAPIAGLP
jgi:hypothetical protein